MKLTNRGVNAQEAASILEVTEQEINNMHSRQSQNLPYVRHIPEPQPKSDCRFRPISTTQTSPISNPAQALDDLMNSHLNNIWRSLEHRLQVAQAKGDRKLVRLLEAESKQMMLTLR